MMSSGNSGERRLRPDPQIILAATKPWNWVFDSGWLLVARDLRCCMHRGEGVASEGEGGGATLRALQYRLCFFTSLNCEIVSRRERDDDEVCSTTCCTQSHQKISACRLTL